MHNHMGIKMSYLFRVEIVLTAKLISAANIMSFVGTVMLASALTILLASTILSVTFNSFTDELRSVA